MNKKLFVLFSFMAILMLATPVFAQGEPAAAAAAGTNWVAITSGFAMAIAAGLAALGQAKIAPLPAKAWPAILPPAPVFSWP